MQESRANRQADKQSKVMKVTNSTHSRQHTSHESGLLSKAPGRYPNKYAFSNNSNEAQSSFCSCIPALYEFKS